MRILFLFLNLICGILPSLAFFVWIERNSSLPQMGLGWPWISLLHLPTAALVAWDFGLILLFGFFHSIFAQPPLHRALEKAFPPQTIRTVYLMITGLTLTLLMGFWQNTGIVIWYLHLPIQWIYAISLLVFWSFIGASGWIMRRFDPLYFLGLKQLYMNPQDLTRTSGTSALITTGIFSRVRHPIYAFMLLAILVTPVMTLDRITVAAATALYLVFAIPVEEKKLVQNFGKSYENYRRRVPAVVPKIGH